MQQSSGGPGDRALTKIEFSILSPGPHVYRGTVYRTDRGWMYCASTLTGQIFFAGGDLADGIQPTPGAAIQRLLFKLDRAWGWNWDGHICVGVDAEYPLLGLRYCNHMTTSPLVILLAGASGVGKTSVSYRLAHHLRFGLTEVDDFQVILENMTTEEQYPAVHYWRNHNEEARRLTEDQMLAHMIRYSEVMALALELVIANHIDSRAPVVLEGDFILPSLAMRPQFSGIPADGSVRAVVLYEGDESQIARNYAAREGQEQPGRARTSWLHSEWLRAEAERLGVPAVSAQPWGTVLERIVDVIGPVSIPD